MKTTSKSMTGGSSPLARGTLNCRPNRLYNVRLIPARAGNTRRALARRPLARAHPRSRGEHIPALVVLDAVLGSSPLARGTLHNNCDCMVVPGLIPARAGNTLLNRPIGDPCRAHPRSRGEHAVGGMSKLFEPGSSPLARGTRSGTELRILFPGLIPARAGNTPRGSARRRVLGLIPARAGNTKLRGSVMRLPRAHPRSRGEHRKVEMIAEIFRGSSPLARGTPGRGLGLESLGGLIPARAGNTWQAVAPVPAPRAHPRSRGEHTRPMSLNLLSGGSSPLARGTQLGIFWHPYQFGLIPARAGNTKSPSTVAASARAHPRSRGEHPLTQVLSPEFVGSSPLARGTQESGQDSAGLLGLIPARAGNTI